MSTEPRTMHESLSLTRRTRAEPAHDSTGRSGSRPALTAIQPPAGHRQSRSTAQGFVSSTLEELAGECRPRDAIENLFRRAATSGTLRNYSSSGATLIATTQTPLAITRAIG
jgi:hypothetical protein